MRVWLSFACLAMACGTSVTDDADGPSTPEGFVSSVQLTPRTLLRLASVEDGRSVLGAGDEHTRSMSSLDRQVRLQSTMDPGEVPFLSFVQEQVRAISEVESQRMAAVLRELVALFSSHGLQDVALPEVVWLIKTTGKEEANAGAYTRHNAVILPELLFSVLEVQPEDVVEVVAHELFHVYSRANEKKRDRFYGLFGFVSCVVKELPDETQDRIYTNPDAPVFGEYCIDYEDVSHQRHWVTPINLASHVYQGGGFLDYYQPQLLGLLSKDSFFVPKTQNGELQIFKMDDGYRTQVGGNTSYNHHPEEITAVHFAMGVVGRSARNQQLVEKVLEITEE